MTNADELKDKGVELYQQYDFEAATKAFEQAKDAYLEAGQKGSAAEMLVNIGLVHRSLDEGQQAIDVMQEALLTFQEMQDALRTAQTLGNLGGVYAKISDKEQAYNCYRQAADIFEELGEKQMYGETLAAMSALQVKDRKIMEGMSTYEAALENMDEINASQRVIKGLLGIRNRVLGGGQSRQGSSTASSEETSDKTE